MCWLRAAFAVALDCIATRTGESAPANPGDQALVASRHHRGQLVIETRVGPPVAGQAEVNRG